MNNEDELLIIHKTMKLILNSNFKRKLDYKLLNIFSKYFKLEFGNNFNNSIDLLPNSILELSFVYNSIFNQSIDNLPNSILKLKFGRNFNKTVDYLPNSILDLHFGLTFNQLVNYLPNKIINLHFGQEFNQSVDNLPISIKNLKFETRFYQPTASLPCFIDNLHLGCTNSYYTYHLPKSIIYLSINYSYQPIKLLHNSLYSLKLHDCSKQMLDLLPNSIKILNLEYNIISLDLLPNSIITLIIGRYFNPIFFLPNSIINLTLIHDLNKKNLNLNSFSYLTNNILNLTVNDTNKKLIKYSILKSKRCLKSINITWIKLKS